MIAALDAHRPGIAALCRCFHVQRMDVFGSAARGTDFDPARSDVDLLVSYLPGHPATFASHLDLRDELASLLGPPFQRHLARTVPTPINPAGVPRSRPNLRAVDRPALARRYYSGSAPRVANFYG